MEPGRREPKVAFYKRRFVKMDLQGPDLGPVSHKAIVAFYMRGSSKLNSGAQDWRCYDASRKSHFTREVRQNLALVLRPETSMTQAEICIVHTKFVKIELWDPGPGARMMQAESRILHGRFVKNELTGPRLGPV